MSNLRAPKIQQFIDWLKRMDYGHWNDCTTYDEKSYELIDALYQELAKIAPMGDRKRKELWLRADRGTIDEWIDLDEAVEDGEFESKEEATSYWTDLFPDEEYWYHFLAIEDDDTGFRGIFLQHQYVIEVDPRKEKSVFPHNISELSQWLLDEVKRCVGELESGVYNENVRKNLPPQHRTGTITRKEIYDIFPDQRDDFFADLSEQDKQDFIRFASDDVPEKRLQHMTANDFFRFCSYGYVANNYKGTSRSPREQYAIHADGRDDGLLEIESESPEAFYAWLSDRTRFGGHPWEVCRGGNSTHISLNVHHDGKGYYLTLAGDAWTRTVETVKFYLALYRRDIPLCLLEAPTLVMRLQETEKIGIVPEGIMPAYCEGYFPNEHVITFRNLPEENRDEVVDHCVWQEIDEVKLAE